MPFINSRNTKNSLDRFNRAPPGISLSSPPGKMPFEKPAKYATPSEAVDALIDNIERPEVEEQFVQLMAAGVTVEELVETMTLMGFTEGQFSADVAEIIKPPLGFYLMGLAAAADIPVRPFKGDRDGLPPEPAELDDADIFNIMRVRNPEFASYLLQRPQLEAQKQEDLKQRLAGSFLGVSPEDLEGEYEEVEDMGEFEMEDDAEEMGEE
jgi:hypothetical protein